MPTPTPSSTTPGTATGTWIETVSRPAYPFGFGLSYTTFTLESATAAVDGGAIRVRAAVKNTGGRAGTDVLQVYAVRDDSGRPERLIGFDRFEVEAGREALIEIDVPLQALAERDVDSHAMVVRPGTYLVRVGRHSADDGIHIRVPVDGPGVQRA